MQINPKTLLIVGQSRVEGGKETSRKKVREDVEGNRLETEANVTTIVHDTEERRTAEALVAEAAYEIKKRCNSTPIGWLMDQAKLADLDQAMQTLRARAASFNATSKYSEIRIGYLTIEISVALGPEAARALADHVREEMEALRDALRAGDASKSRAVLLRTANLDAFSVGVQAESVRMAHEEGKTRLSDLKAKIKANETPESAGRGLDLSMIEAAIGMFSYAGMPDAPASEGAPLGMVAA